MNEHISQEMMMSNKIQEETLLTLGAWTTANAFLTLLASLASLFLDRIFPISGAAAVSFVTFIALNRSRWTPSGRFGHANAITCARLVLILAMPFAAGLWGAFAGVVIGSVSLAADGTDGWTARHYGDDSTFGAHFDMETDAFFILTLSFMVSAFAGVGGWALIAGLLRYGYVLIPRLSDIQPKKPPRSFRARAVFALSAILLLTALVSAPAISKLCALSAVTALSLSFLLDYIKGGRRA